MRFVKLGLFSIVFFFLLLTAMASLLPSTVNISRAIDINAPVDVVFNYVHDVSTWPKWYGNDTTSAMSVTQAIKGRGASVKINNTIISIKESVADKEIKATWQNNKSEPLAGRFNFFPQKTSSQTTMQWNFTQHVKWYPWEKFASIFSGRTTGPFMEQSLDKLKQNLENH